MQNSQNGFPVARFGGGCFWCVEAEFKRLDGVVSTSCGYEGGALENPTYRDICTGATEHAEALEIVYDPTKLSYRDLLIHFLTRAHDPSQINGQGVDIGTQYRSVIFYANDAEKQGAQDIIDTVNDSKQWKDPVATSLEPHTRFWMAEDGHQNYYETYEEKSGSPHVNILYKRRKWAQEK